MRQPLCVVSSDWHLEKNAWVRYPGLSGDSYYGLLQIIDICIDKHLPLIAAGDLFDKPYPDSRSVYEAMRQMDRMKEKALKVYYTQGQHEKSRDQPWLSLHPHPLYIHNRTVCIAPYQITFAGLDYTRPDELPKAIEKICQNLDVLVCHQVWGNFMGSIRSNDGRLEDVPVNKAIITGDYHRHVDMAIEGVKGPILILSPGSICLQSIDEPPNKAVFILYDDMTVESIPLKSRTIHSHILNKKQDLDDFLSGIELGMLEPQDGVPDEIAKNILVARYNPDIPNAYKSITEIVKDRVHLFMRPISKELDMRIVEVKAANETIELGLEGNLAKLCSPDSSTYVIARRLLNSSNPKTELNIIQKEFLEKGTTSDYC